MIRPLLLRISSVFIGVLALLEARCTFPEKPVSGVSPLPTSLQGSWRMDSSHATFYTGSGRVLNHLWYAHLEPNQRNAVDVMTIGPTQWHYQGRVRATYDYARHGDTLVLQRLADTNLVRAGHARSADLGRPLGPPQTSVITTLSAHSLVRRDSTQDPDGTLIRVWRSYYSR